MKYLGIDFGLKRIGLSQSEGQLASPLKTIEIRNINDGVEQILQTVNSERFDKLVVGLPEGKVGKTVLRFVKALKKNGLDVEFADETLSSKKALEQQILMDIPKSKRRFNDSIAAVIILQDYLDSL